MATLALDLRIETGSVYRFLNWGLLLEIDRYLDEVPIREANRGSPIDEVNREIAEI